MVFASDDVHQNGVFDFGNPKTSRIYGTNSINIIEIGTVVKLIW